MPAGLRRRRRHALLLIAPAAAITLEDLPELAQKLRQKTDEDRTRTPVLADNEAGRKSSDELKQKLDEALTAQGETKQRITDLEQAVAKGLKAANEEVDEDNLGFQLQKAYDEREDLKAMVQTRARSAARRSTSA